MTARHGSIGKFEPENEEWVSYVERLSHYLQANDVEDAGKQRAILLSGCGAKTYQLIRSLVAPRKPADIEFSVLVEEVRNHFNPKPSVIVERFQFHSRVRKMEESVSTYVAELRRLSQHCDFGESLEYMLRDRIVCGINDNRIQRRLLAEADLSFKKAFELALAMESADRNTQDLQKATGQAATVYSVRQGGVCYRCGGRHWASDCRFCDAECRACGKKGHIARACRTRTLEAKAIPAGQEKSRSQRASAHVVREEIVEVEEDPTTVYSMFSMFRVDARESNPIYVDILAHRQPLKMELDTGASVSVISEAKFQSTWRGKDAPILQPSEVKLQTYTGEEISVVGCIQVVVEHNGCRKELPLLVVQGDGPSLLGRDWLKVLQLDWGEIQSFLEEFREELALIKGVNAKIHVSQEAQPCFCKPSAVPFSLRKSVDLELDRLEKEGDLEPVAFSGAFSGGAAPLVPVYKDDGSVRFCGDIPKRNGVKHLTSAPYHPASNGLAERAVKMMGGILKLSGPLEVWVVRFLFKFGVTSQSTRLMAECLAASETLENTQPLLLEGSPDAAILGMFGTVMIPNPRAVATAQRDLSPTATADSSVSTAPSEQSFSSGASLRRLSRIRKPPDRYIAGQT